MSDGCLPAMGRVVSSMLIDQPRSSGKSLPQAVTHRQCWLMLHNVVAAAQAGPSTSVCECCELVGLALLLLLLWHALAVLIVLQCALLWLQWHHPLSVRTLAGHARVAARHVVTDRPQHYPYGAHRAPPCT
jgi:hypothetical protein